ncbi:nucleoside/nucleotide kinase family protein [Roseinatronobacter monicus]|uniref:Pantothenate kinase n=1 Tax=Roseinatronobacter monicus TaxID=393481 RepID=A0A543K3L4_9RHOB|nr:nucleoside/nucleotide kinase family protein [Roseinatronobacter monicus]TQM89670.1 pantothenate kinase [Roseinatronobacter monicus]
MIYQSGVEREDWMNELTARLVNLASNGRSLVAIAGAPGSGKSTLSDTLCARLNAHSSGLAAVVQMDGFHFDDVVLRSQGTLARKGAPFTFDVCGLRSLLERLRTNHEGEIAVPVFDRELEISRGGARLIPQNVPIILVEGNYLLLDEAPWDTLHSLFDLKIALDVPLDELERRLVNRWVTLGFERREAIEKARANDLMNARKIREQSVAADIDLSLA